MQTALSKRKRAEAQGKQPKGPVVGGKQVRGDNGAIKGDLQVPWITMPGPERDIILDRLRKELVPLIKVEVPPPPSEGEVEEVRALTGEGDEEKQKKQKSRDKRRERVFKKAYTTLGVVGVSPTTQQRIRSMLCFGVNEASRALEKDSVTLLFICRDVKPIRLVDHLATAARRRGVPFLVLPKASTSLGEVFGMKRMACLAIKKPPQSPSQPAATDSGQAVIDDAPLAQVKSLCELLLQKEAFLN